MNWMEKHDNFYCSVLSRLYCYVIRDDQDLTLPVIISTTAKIHNAQEVVIPLFLQRTANIRAGQEVQLPLFIPSTTKLHVSQDLTFLVVGNSKYPVTFVVT